MHTKTLFLPSSFILLAAFCLLGPKPIASAEEETNIKKIGVVNLRRVFEGYGRTQTSEEKLEKLTVTQEAKREEIVSEIRSLRDEFILLNEESRLKQRGVIEEKMKGLASFDEKAKVTLRSEQAESVKSILKEIEATVETFAKKQSYDLVITDQTILYGSEAIDVTDEILALLNQSYKKGR